MKKRLPGICVLVLFVFFVQLIPILPRASVEAASVCQVGDKDEEVVVRVYYKDIKQIDLLSAFDLFEYNNLSEKYVLVAIAKSRIPEIEKLGFTVSIDETETENYKRLELLSSQSINTIPGYSCYRTVEETYTTAQSVANTHPNLATWIDVGDSWEKSVGQSDGYDMMVLKLTNNQIQIDKPRLFMIASIHAREYTTAETALRFAEYLVNNYGDNPDVTWILDYHEIHIMFQANPDGRKEAESGLSWRKNTNENYCGVTSTNRGADLNRNFNYQWGGAGSSSSPCDATYRGPAADSEPETRAIRDYMLSLFPDQRDSGAAPLDATGVFIDLHSYGGYVLWPWSYTSSTTPNDTQLQTLGRKIAYFNNYLPGQTGQDLYLCSGVTPDLAYGQLGVAAYTIEMGTAFFQSCSSFESTIYPANLQALLYAAKVVRTPYMTPSGPDAINLALSEAEVIVGQNPTLSATINDTRYSSRNGSEPVQTISQAEYYIDTPPWISGATAIPMAAADGSFNSSMEAVTTVVATSGLTQGRHTLFIRGKDQAGNWGAVSAIFLTVLRSDNQPPDANDLSITTNEDVPINLTLSGSDGDGDPLTFRVTAAPAHGALSGIAPTLTYTPAANYFGTDSFMYVANDGFVDSAPATVSITVQSVNDKPIATPQSITTIVNVPVIIVLQGSDADGDVLTFTVVTNPTHGALSGSGQNLLYTPASGFTGSDNFTFKVNDGIVDSDPATVSITVNPPGPVQIFWDNFETDLGWVRNPNGTDNATTGMWERANPQDTNSNGPKQLGTTVSGSYDLVTGPLAGRDAGSYDIDSGVTSIISPSITLPANSQLTLTLSYYLAHGSNSSSADYLRITIIGNTSQQIFEELGASNDDDAAWAGLTSDISAFAGQTIRILIAAADNSTASLVEAAVDDVLIQGVLLNNPPIADPQAVSLAEDTTLGIALTGSDPDGDPLTFNIVQAPAHGTLSGTVPNVVYQPEANFNGSDSFTFTVSDGQLTSNPATVSINVTPVNDAPQAQSQTPTMDEDGTLNITLVATDPDGDPLMYNLESNPGHGTLTGTLPELTYTPDANYFGSDSFSFTATDGTLTSEIATINITINSVNDVPVADDLRLNIDEDYFIKFSLNGSDVEGDVLTYIILTQPANGTLSGEGRTHYYTPEANWNGIDSFTYAVSDGQAESEPATVRIVVAATNDAPVAIPQLVSTPMNTLLSITLEGEDVDGDTLLFEVVTQPEHGTLSGTAPDLTYTPVTDYVGSDSFTFRVYDAEYWMDEAEVSITVTSAGNHKPQAVSQQVIAEEDTEYYIVLEGSDPDGDPLHYLITSGPTHGSLSGDDSPVFVYLSELNYSGTDQFTFVVSDGALQSDPATVNITVNPVNDPPIADDLDVTTQAGTPVNITLTGSDQEGDDIYFLVVSLPSHGTIDGLEPDLVYTPNPGYIGADAFTYKANDGHLDSPIAVVSIMVEPELGQIFFDDFESDLGWIVNPFNTDTATSGLFERGDPEVTYYMGVKQLGTAHSGSYDLVTGASAGANANANDIDGGFTSIRSPMILLPTQGDITLSFWYYLAHANNSSSVDYLRVKVVGSTTQQIFQEVGASVDDDAVWQQFTFSLNGFRSQTIYLLITAADLKGGSLVEAAIDDVLIEAN